MHGFQLGFINISDTITNGIPINKSFYFNPEIVTQNEINNENQVLLDLALNTGYYLSKKIHVIIGPSLVRNNASKNEDVYKEFYSLKK